jgi:hypothetical protein
MIQAPGQSHFLHLVPAAVGFDPLNFRSLINGSTNCATSTGKVKITIFHLVPEVAGFELLNIGPVVNSLSPVPPLLARSILLFTSGSRVGWIQTVVFRASSSLLFVLPTVPKLLARSNLLFCLMPLLAEFKLMNQ